MTSIPSSKGAGSPGAAHFGLEAREQLLSEAEQAAHMGSFAWDVPRDVIHWSDELYRILGHEPGGVVPSAELFFAAVDPRDRQRVREASARGVSTGVTEPVEFRVLRADGTTRNVLMTGNGVFDADRKPTRFVGAVLDLTERVEREAELRRREEVLRLAQRIARVGSFEWNPWAGTTTWSEELHAICGVPLSEKGTPELYFSLVHPDDRHRVTSAAAALEPGQEVAPMEYRLVRADGTVVDVHATAFPVNDVEGRPAGLVGTVLDITQRKRLEAQLLQSQKMEALGRLAGGVAHDFNNLLTVIGVQVALLRRRRDDGELAEVSHAVQRAADLTRQLLAFSRQAVFERRRVDPEIVLREALRMVQRIVGEDIRLSFHASVDVGAVEADPAQLGQVLMNLVVNARDALQAGGSIDVSLYSVELARPPEGTEPPLAPGEYVVLAVGDDGVGMDESVRRRAFEPFFTTKKPGEGTGLGLAMVFGIVTNAGGAISLQSAKGKGTTVRVYLPRTRKDPALAAPAEDEGTPQAHGGTILLVEDSHTIRGLLKAILEESGFDVIAAADGEAALVLFEARWRDLALVVTDVVMPGMGGPDLVRRLRTRLPELPVLYVSGYARESMADEDPMTRGALLKKPFLPAELTQKVGELMGKVSRARDRGTGIRRPAR